MWVTSQSPDASFDSCQVSNCGKNTKVKNLLEANITFRKSQSSTLRLLFPDTGNPEYLMVIHTWKRCPMASETMAIAESADAGHFVALMTKDIFELKTAPRVFCKTDTAQKMKFSIKDFFIKCDKIRRFQRIWANLLKKSLMENLFFMCSDITNHRKNI